MAKRKKVLSRSELTWEQAKKEGRVICEYCDVRGQGLRFVIGYSSKPDWCMVAGQGIACPECYPVVSVRGVKFAAGPCSLCGEVRLINGSSVCVPCSVKRSVEGGTNANLS